MQRYMKLTAILVMVWLVKGFETIDGVMSFLNELSPEVSQSAKVMTLGPNRLLAGAFSNPYYVIYSSDNPEDIKAYQEKVEKDKAAEQKRKEDLEKKKKDDEYKKKYYR